MVKNSMNRPRLAPVRKNNPEAMRARILEAAFQLFQEQGFHATSMQDIAGAAGVSKGAMHHHFETKKLIGLAVIREQVSGAFDEVWLQPLRSSEVPLEATFEIFRDLARQFDERRRVVGCPINNLTLELASSDIDYRSALRPLFDEWRKSLADSLLADPDSEFADAGSAASAAALIVAAYSGAMSMAKVEQCGTPLAECADELERLLSRDLGKCRTELTADAMEECSS